MTINPAHRDGQRHTVECTTGAGFIATWAAYREDGFYCQTPRMIDGNVRFDVCKPMPGDNW